MRLPKQPKRPEEILSEEKFNERNFTLQEKEKVCGVIIFIFSYSQTKWSVPLKIALMNCLFETWTRWSFQECNNELIIWIFQEYG